MRILFIENIANVTYNLAKALRRKGYDVVMLTRYNPKTSFLDLCNFSDDPWVKTFKCSSMLDKSFIYLLKILSYNVDIIHCHQAFVQSSYSLFSKTLGKASKVIAHCHGSDLREFGQLLKYGWLINMNLRHVDHVFVSTPDLLNYWSHATFLPNPVDTSRFKPSSPTLDLHRGHDYAILAPARQVWTQKRQDVFLHALKAIIEDGYDCNLLMVDYGVDSNKTKQLAKDLHLEHHVSFAPLIRPEAMPEYYNSADMTWDQIGLGAMGMISLEALACNKPVLSDFNYYNAYPELPPLIRAYSLKDIVTETEKVIDSYNFKVNTRWWITKYHSYEAVLPKLIGVYESLLLSDKVESFCVSGNETNMIEAEAFARESSLEEEQEEYS